MAAHCGCWVLTTAHSHCHPPPTPEARHPYPDTTADSSQDGDRQAYCGSYRRDRSHHDTAPHGSAQQPGRRRRGGPPQPGGRPPAQRLPGRLCPGRPLLRCRRYGAPPHSAQDPRLPAKRPTWRRKRCLDSQCAGLAGLPLAQGSGRPAAHSTAQDCSTLSNTRKGGAKEYLQPVSFSSIASA